MHYHAAYYLIGQEVLVFLVCWGKYSFVQNKSNMNEWCYLTWFEHGHWKERIQLVKTKQNKKKSAKWLQFSSIIMNIE